MKLVTDSWIDGFTKANPHITLKPIYVPAQYTTKLTSLVAAGDAPDVMWLFSGQVGPLVEQNQLSQLDAFLKADNVDIKDFPQGAVEGLSYGGKLMALPQAIFIQALWYNKGLFDQAGLKYPDRTWTWDTVQEAAAKLTKGEGATKQFGYGVRSPSYAFHDAAYVWRNGGEFFDKDFTKTLLDQEPAVKGLEWYYGLKNTLKVAPSTAEMQATPEFSTGRSFQTKRIAMLMDTNLMPLLAGPIEGLKYDMEVFPLPNGGRRGGPVFSDNIAIIRSAKEQDAAWQLLKYQLGDEAQWERSKTGWNSPVRLSTLKDPKFATLKGLNWQVLVDELQWSRPSLDYLPFAAKIGQVLTPELQAAHAGTKSVKDAIAAAVPKLNEVLKEAKR
jgi:multiple sugar transport system substrate-binding protein